MKRPIKERFLEKVVKQDSGCHEWTGSLAKNGYGNFHKDGKTHYSHRIAWEIEHGEEPSDYILHKCDNRKCVNPDHLFVGSFYDNMDDMVEKGRQAHGEKNHHAKLTAEKVLQIRQEVGLQREIAAKYNITPSLVSMIRSGRIWKYI
jgi:hypothetical protein